MVARGPATLPPKPVLMPPITVAENVTVDSRGILINGMRLPFYLAPEPVEVIVQEAPHFTEITFTLLTESVNITSGVEARSDGVVTLIEPEEGL
jgi:hypothetical protein